LAKQWPLCHTFSFFEVLSSPCLYGALEKCPAPCKVEEAQGNGAVGAARFKGSVCEDATTHKEK